jgi:hypothetical protein
MCSQDCHLQSGMLGFITKGFYPSSPVRPQFAFYEDIMRFFYGMFTRGTCSKPVFIGSLRSLLQAKTDIEVKLYLNVNNMSRFPNFINGFVGPILRGWT